MRKVSLPHTYAHSGIAGTTPEFLFLDYAVPSPKWKVLSLPYIKDSFVFFLLINVIP